MRLPLQPSREVVWTVEWDSGPGGQRQAWGIILEERFGIHKEFLIGKKTYKVFVRSMPLECGNTPRYFEQKSQARKHARILLAIYGGFITEPEWVPGSVMISRWMDPMWIEKWHRTMKRPSDSEEASDTSPMRLLTV